PKDAGKEGVARFRYRDKAGKDRTYEWPLEGQSGKPLTLPDSDLSVTFEDVIDFPLANSGFGQGVGDASIPLAQFKVRKGEGEPVLHYGWSLVPPSANMI